MSNLKSRALTSHSMKGATGAQRIFTPRQWPVADHVVQAGGGEHCGHMEHSWGDVHRMLSVAEWLIKTGWVSAGVLS